MENREYYWVVSFVAVVAIVAIAMTIARTDRSTSSSFVGQAIAGGMGTASLPEGGGSAILVNPANGKMYVYGKGLVASIKGGTSGDFSQMTYFAQDFISTNRFTTNQEARIQSKMSTYPYGKTLSKESSLGGKQKYTFTGKEDDGKLMYFGARYMDPRVGRFTSVDPISRIGTNYAYADDNPVRYKDPSGGSSFEAKFSFMLDGYLNTYGTNMRQPELGIIPKPTTDGSTTNWAASAKYGGVSAGGARTTSLSGAVTTEASLHVGPLTVSGANSNSPSRTNSASSMSTHGGVIPDGRTEPARGTIRGVTQTASSGTTTPKPENSLKVGLAIQGNADRPIRVGVFGSTGGTTTSTQSSEVKTNTDRYGAGGWTPIDPASPGAVAKSSTGFTSDSTQNTVGVEVGVPIGDQWTVTGSYSQTDYQSTNQYNGMDPFDTSRSSEQGRVGVTYTW